jgi:hypothetical protein
MLSEEPTAVVVLDARWISPPGAFLVDVGRPPPHDHGLLGLRRGGALRLQPATRSSRARSSRRERKADLRASANTRGVDSGVAVPMYFLAPDRDLPIVPLSARQSARRRVPPVGRGDPRRTRRVARARCIRGERHAEFNEHEWDDAPRHARGGGLRRAALDALRDRAGGASWPTATSVRGSACYPRPGCCTST